MKKIILMAALLLAASTAWAQRALLEYSLNNLYYGEETTALYQSGFSDVVLSWNLKSAHIVVHPDCTLESIQALQNQIPIRDITWSMAMEAPVVLREVSQTQYEASMPKIKPIPITDADTPAVFPAGDPGVWIVKNLYYPALAEQNGIQGRVIVTFTISRFGHIEDIRVLKSADPFLDEAAVRIVGAMPDWTPATKDGAPIPVTYTLPVVFRLN